MRDLVGGDRAEIFGGHGDDGDRLAGERGGLDLEAGASGMRQDDRSDVSGFEPRFREVSSQHDRFELCKSGAQSRSGSRSRKRSIASTIGGRSVLTISQTMSKSTRS